MTKYIKTYESIKDGEDYIKDLMILTIPFLAIEEDGSFYTFSASNVANADAPSIILVVDINTVEQIEKLKVVYEDNRYRLCVKDGEEFTYPTETPEQKKIRELKEQLAALEASQNQGE